MVKPTYGNTQVRNKRKYGKMLVLKTVVMEKHVWKKCRWGKNVGIEKSQVWKNVDIKKMQVFIKQRY